MPEGMGYDIVKAKEDITKRLLELRKRLKKVLTKEKKGGKQTYYGKGKEIREDIEALRKRQQEAMNK